MNTSKSLNPHGKNYVYKVMNSPIGELKLIGSDHGLAAILWHNADLKALPMPIAGENKEDSILLEAEHQLHEYFSGKRQKFSVKLDFAGTEFQKKVWQALLSIPFGETRSYGHIARQIGNSKAVRAVGTANSKNPIPIIAPCHRVIGSSGKLTGFAGGMETKAYLLQLEGSKISGKADANTRVLSPKNAGVALV